MTRSPYADGRGSKFYGDLRWAATGTFVYPDGEWRSFVGKSRAECREQADRYGAWLTVTWSSPNTILTDIRGNTHPDKRHGTEQRG